MTLTSTPVRTDYDGTSALTDYDYTFKIRIATDLKAKVRRASTGIETDLVYLTDFTLDGVGETNGGTVTLIEASQAWMDGSAHLKTGYHLTLYRQRPRTQTTDVKNQGSYYPTIHEDAFDHQVMLIQEHDETIGRSMKLPRTVIAADFDPTYPAEIVGAISKAPVTNDAGDGFAPVSEWPSVADILGANASAVAAAASAAAASTSETNAATSETAAGISAAAADASAIAAAASAAGAAAGNAPSVTGSWGSPTVVTAVGGITVPVNANKHTFIMYVKGSVSGSTISANPQISAGASLGDRLVLIHVGPDADFLTLVNGTGITQNGERILIGGSCVEYVWGGSTPGWVMCGNNLI